MKTQTPPRAPITRLVFLISAVVGLLLVAAAPPQQASSSHKRKSFMGVKGRVVAQLTGTVGGGQLKNYAVAIPDFKNEGTGSNKRGKAIAKILRNDFRLSGIFRVISPTAYLEKAPKNGIELGKFEFKPWSQINAQVLVKGSYRDEGSKIRIKFRFYEVGTEKLTVKEDYLVPYKNISSLRWYVHLFSEKVYRSLTNEKGIFTTKIAAIRQFAGKHELYVMDFDGFNARRITNNGSINVLPAWSPNGKYIAYTSYKARNPDIYILDISTGRSRKLTSFRGLNSGAAWSPDSSQIAFSASRSRAKMDIYVINVGSRSTRCLTCRHQPSWSSHLSPSWSPDGKQIAFVSTRQGSPQIFVMNANGGSSKRLTTIGKYNQSPKWSPKGDWILFTGRDEKLVFDVFAIKPDGTGIRRLTQNQGKRNGEGAWSSNGRNVVYSSTRNGFSKLFVARSDGKNAQQITFMAGKFVTPTWSPPFAK